MHFYKYHGAENDFILIDNRNRKVKGKVESVKVEMGRPLFERERIPALGEGLFMEENMEIDGREFSVSALNTGVPHAVIFVEDVESISVKKYGSRLRNDGIFPEGANVNFVQPLDKNAFKIRTYERGVEDETWACGTGITASAVMAVRLGLAKGRKPLRMDSRGSILFINVKMEGKEIETAFMSGPARLVFEGES